MNKKLITISYTLFGQNYNYYQPIVKQFELFNNYFYKVFPSEFEYEIIVFIDKTVDVSYFKDLPIRFILNTSEGLLNDVPAKMWRFYNIFFREADVYLFRDSDSTISERELLLIKQWIDSQFNYNVIRDTRLHLYPIMAGTFSVKNEGLNLLKQLLSEKPCFINNRKHFYDQIYLAEIIYPKIISDLLVFSNFLIFENENYIQTDYRIKDFIGGYYFNNKLDKHWHDFKFLKNFPLKSLKFFKYSTRLILLYISILLVSKKIGIKKYN